MTEKEPSTEIQEYAHRDISHMVKWGKVLDSLTLDYTGNPNEQIESLRIQALRGRESARREVEERLLNEEWFPKGPNIYEIDN